MDIDYQVEFEQEIYDQWNYEEAICRVLINMGAYPKKPSRHFNILPDVPDISEEVVDRDAQYEADKAKHGFGWEYSPF
tara:strand:- start:95 stop:328 length:234 start_codon:yes stop_codon:yes gene_type:complete